MAQAPAESPCRSEANSAFGGTVHRLPSPRRQEAAAAASEPSRRAQSPPDSGRRAIAQPRGQVSPPRWFLTEPGRERPPGPPPCARRRRTAAESHGSSPPGLDALTANIRNLRTRPCRAQREQDRGVGIARGKSIATALQLVG